MSPGRRHLESLDVFRGLTIAAMILVNNPGDWNAVFPLLVHAEWNGLTAADVVFPFFVFIMGCAMPFAFARRDAQADGEWRAGARLLRRAMALVGLGLVLNLVAALPHPFALRVPGVLQRLGVTYVCAALVVRACGAATQAVIAVALAAGHWAVMTLVPFAGSLAPVTQAHNLAGYLDARVFGSHTLVPGFDPEGLVGTAPAVATALAGALAGRWLRRHPGHGAQIAGLAAGGAAAIAVGLAWSAAWPINKPLWTGSYALVTAGLAALALAACLFLVDMRGIRGWGRPFLWLGVNPLAIYFCSEVVGHVIDRPLRLFGGTSPKDWLYWHVFSPLTGGRGEWASLLFAVAYVACWIGVSAVLYWREIRIRV